MGTTANALASAKTALANAENFTKGVTKQAGNKTNPFTKPSYTEARRQRVGAPASPPAPKPASKEFMGVRSDEGPELNTALQERQEANRELEKQ